MWSWGVFFFLHSEFIKNSIFDLQNREMLSVQQKCCSAFSKKKKKIQQIEQQLSSHLTYTHLTVKLQSLIYISLCPLTTVSDRSKFLRFERKNPCLQRQIRHESINYLSWSTECHKTCLVKLGRWALQAHWLVSWLHSDL